MGWLGHRRSGRRRASSTATSGHIAWAAASTRSDNPIRGPPPKFSKANQPSSPSRPEAATNQTAGLGWAPRRQARAGHNDSAGKMIAAMAMCAVESPVSGCGNAASKIVAAPPVVNSRRPATAAGRSPAAVITWHSPTPASAVVMIQRSVAPRAASALIVWLTGSKPPGCRAAASCQPPISSNGANVADSTAHRGTVRTPARLAPAATRRERPCRAPPRHHR